MRSLVGFTLGLVFCSSLAQAQVCLGAHSFREFPVHVGAVFTGDDLSNTIGADAAFGSASGWFGGVGLAGVTIDDVPGTGALVSGFVGQDIAVDRAARAFVCGVATVSYQSGPNPDPLNLSVLDAGGLIGFGYRAFTSAQGIQIIPHVNGQVRRHRATLSIDEFDETLSDTYGIVSVGVGVLIDHVFLIPSIRIPISTGDNDAQFLFRAGVSF